MMDFIDREQALKALEELIIARRHWLSDARQEIKGIDACICEIEGLPSARPKGKWIDGKRMGYDGTFHWFRQCSECLYEREDDTPEKDTNYCPNCGADMRGEQDDQ